MSKKEAIGRDSWFSSRPSLAAAELLAAAAAKGFF